MRNDKVQKPCYNITGDGFYNLLKGYTWLRSGADPDSYYAYYHSAVGMSYTAAYPERTLAVRPATHMIGFSLGTRTDFSKQRISVVLPSEISKRIATRLRARNRGFLCRG